eukprot:TRINITY_DN2353_c0_g2_i7.p1 TRINITY_DN2353_c0_g2~~TRINITY_DN2353_c0_g2_i7.p1  ORF type:complete len:625 (+),score=144.14 TRINITY_DN2353_c0_g2_i7:258-2132(+)
MNGKVLHLISTPGSFLGLSSLLMMSSSQELQLVMKTDVTVKQISIPLLISLFQGDPGLHMRFFRDVLTYIVLKMLSLLTGNLTFSITSRPQPQSDGGKSPSSLSSDSHELFLENDGEVTNHEMESHNIINLTKSTDTSLKTFERKSSKSKTRSTPKKSRSSLSQRKNKSKTSESEAISEPKFFQSNDTANDQDTRECLKNSGDRDRPNKDVEGNEDEDEEKEKEQERENQNEKDKVKEKNSGSRVHDTNLKNDGAGDDNSSSSSDSDTEEGNEVENEILLQKLKQQMEGSQQKKAELYLLYSKFRIPPEEELLSQSSCHIVYRINSDQVGRLYLFQNHLCLYCSLFGMETHEVFEMGLITQMKILNDTIHFLYKGKKDKTVTKVDPNTLSLLNTIWSENFQKATNKSTIYESIKLKSEHKTPDFRSSQAMQRTKYPELSSDDWNKILSETHIQEFTSPHVLIQEGQKLPLNRSLYCIGGGDMVLTVYNEPDESSSNNNNDNDLNNNTNNNTNGNNRKTSCLTFGIGDVWGEPSFFGNQGSHSRVQVTATAGTSIYFIDEVKLNLLFLSDPTIAGRFFYRLACLFFGKLDKQQMQVSHPGLVGGGTRRPSMLISSRSPAVQKNTD